ncbi:GspH/FimT family pseudopilin [Shewanella sp. 1_MG-2023]|uniref:GspH/FimT family pseudopilin n=1 Tax=unclassified Shewanella TaxID=196818 RepID=UPI000C864136|nr:MULTISPECIES: GspH/FimT family pseudopilin [unclassified Shewanella]MDO6610063.1 GspH/FimT family pseudopilin [Shewanella sp. 7_MG-2023]MDO6769795.1 GspH/FimT family pseudopilin [Shewanella sp. 2_MG-2023]MDO6792859.1 GspH/FimT family pseudopilin [Shewanella sp. 1_MG-2023]PMG71510.1 general secretion pathway protein GspH [Shewanella sp. 10N.286.51.B7]
MKHDLKGFTLVELMVTVAVAAILLTVGVPSLVSLYEGQRANSNISKINSSMQFARSQAVSYGSRVSVCPFNGTSCDSDWTQGFSIFIDNGTLGSLDSTNGIQDTVLRSVEGFNSDDFISSSLSRYTFNADGLMNLSQTGNIIYCPGKKTHADSRGITIGVSGRISNIETAVTCQ